MNQNLQFNGISRVLTLSQQLTAISGIGLFVTIICFFIILISKKDCPVCEIIANIGSIIFGVFTAASLITWAMGY